MESQHGSNSHRQKSAETVLCLTGNLNAAPQHHQIQKQQDHRADKAPLLAYHRKDKVRVVLRQKVQLALSSLKKPLAKEHA